MQPTPIKRRKLSHEVLDQLLADIRSGEYPVGSTFPPERELQKRFSVGRPAVREALQAMERMGFVAIKHGEGALVLPVSASTLIGQLSNSVVHLLSNSQDLLEHLKESRLFFEVGMVRMLTARATAADLEKLSAALEDCRSNQNNGEKFKQADMKFHRTIAELTGNPIYAAISQAMLEWLGEFYSQLVSSPGTESLIVREHSEILNGIAAGDADGASNAMIAHLTRANPRYRLSSER